MNNPKSQRQTENPASRRQLLRSLLAGGTALGAGALGMAGMTNVWAQAAPQGTTRLGQGRLVLVFLRGAYDGLSAFVPYSDADYYALRPNIAIAAPDGGAQTALKLDNTFALHPSLSPLMPLWQQGVLSFVPAAGLATPNRSHFDAQYQMETAQNTTSSATPGWLNKLATLDGQLPAAIGVGEANPAILAGDASVRLIPRGDAAVRTGVLANDKTRLALMKLYAGNDRMSEAFRQGAVSRMQSAQELNTEKVASDNRRSMAMLENKRQAQNAQTAQMLAANNGAASPQGLQLDARHLGTLMRNNRHLALGFLSAGGWDTHANQGHATGDLANNFANLARGLTQLRQDFSEPGDLIVVLSEFGRTSAENGTKGTDHGWGNALWLMGDRVNGGRWHGEWTGLARGKLNEARDLPAHHDYRAVLAQVLQATFALPESDLAMVLPETSWDKRLDGLLHRG
ncbi:MAG: DUF1501 domain-containing protein [Pseudomonadota bacterium]